MQLQAPWLGGSTLSLHGALAEPLSRPARADVENTVQHESRRPTATHSVKSYPYMKSLLKSLSN